MLFFITVHEMERIFLKIILKIIYSLVMFFGGVVFHIFSIVGIRYYVEGDLEKKLVLFFIKIKNHKNFKKKTSAVN